MRRIQQKNKRHLLCCRSRIRYKSKLYYICPYIGRREATVWRKGNKKITGFQSADAQAPALTSDFYKEKTRQSRPSAIATRRPRAQSAQQALTNNMGKGSRWSRSIERNGWMRQGIGRRKPFTAILRSSRSKTNKIIEQPGEGRQMYSAMGIQRWEKPGNQRTFAVGGIGAIYGTARGRGIPRDNPYLFPPEAFEIAEGGKDEYTGPYAKKTYTY